MFVDYGDQQQYYLRKNEFTVWKVSAALGEVKDTDSELETRKILFADSIIKIIAVHCNKEIERGEVNYIVQNKVYARGTDTKEILVVIALLYIILPTERLTNPQSGICSLNGS